MRRTWPTANPEIRTLGANQWPERAIPTTNSPSDPIAPGQDNQALEARTARRRGSGTIVQSRSMQNSIPRPSRNDQDRREAIAMAPAEERLPCCRQMAAVIAP